MKAKARLWILLTAAALALAGITASAAAAASCEDRAHPAEESPAEMGYILTDYEGVIGVFRGGVLIMQTDVRLDTLRRADRELLKEGIEVDSYEALMRLLQDFDA